MNKNETENVCALIRSTYPQYYGNFDDREKRAMSQTWSAVLEEYEYSAVCAGMKAYMANDTNGFPPVPGQIIEQIQRFSKPKNNPTEGEAWGIVYKAICNSAWHSAEEFEKLPPILKFAVGSPNVLKQWAISPNVSATESNFKRSYRAAQEKFVDESKVPESVRKLLENLSERLAVKA